MVQLPSPNSPITAAPSFGDVAHGIANGATVVSRRLYEKKSYSLPYVGLAEIDAGVLLGFYRRLYGTGPFVLVDPSVTNVLPLDVSTCGVRSQATTAWSTSSGSLTRTGTPPTGAPQSGVLRWVPAANATMTACTVAGVLQLLLAPVYLSTEFVTVSMWVQASASTSATLILAGYSSTGTLNSSSLTAAASVTTSWQRFSVTAPVGSGALSSSAFVVPQLKAGASVPATISIAGVQVEYADSAQTWQQGAGSPRVLPTTPPGRDVQQTASFLTDHTFVLAEAV